MRPLRKLHVRGGCAALPIRGILGAVSVRAARISTTPMLHRILLRASTTVLTIAALSALHPAQAQNTVHATRVANGLVNPLYVTAPTGDFNRLFIVEQRSGSIGRIRILDLTQNPPVLLATPYLSISPVAVNDEQGLLGLAFHPDFANNGYFYVNYTNSAGTTVVARYTANAPYMTSVTADATSAQTVLTQAQPQVNHNGGWTAFGPDGMLYIDFGDGGNANDTGAGHTVATGNAQDLTTWLGKQLRIDVNGDDFPSDPNKNYAVPPTNPFYGAIPGLDEIWNYGLRNPWRASFDRLTGDMWIGDVGQNAIEEVDFIPAGAGGLNLGWRCMEGNNCTGLTGCVCMAASLTDPVYTYAHSGGNCTVIGGYRYRGSALCSFQGLYFFADYCTAKVWTVAWNGTTVTNLTDRTAQLAPGGGLAINSITSFGEDAAGELYICDRGGEVFKIGPGTITDCNGNGVLDECEPTGTAGCFGDGSTPTACPCANIGALGRGCDNSELTGGARLDGFGDPTVDSLVLMSSGERANAPTIFVQGDLLDANGILFGDGVRCATGSLKRLYVKIASSGVVHAPEPGDPSISAQSTILGDPIIPGFGALRYYQAYYRDPDPAFCPAPSGNAYNMSSMLTITW
jgi:glucose/arabinose dehydrogenase